MKLQRHTMEVFLKQFKEQDAAEIESCLAGWINGDTNGQFLSVELSPRYVARRREATPSNFEDFI
jgi:hypothetical protein